MAQLVTYAEEDGVAILGIANPPVNALTAPVRSALIEALDRALDDPGVAAVVIRGEGRGFATGRNAAEFAAPQCDPDLSTLCEHIDAAPKPVVAALHGNVLGGGFELALAAHYRVALGSARFGFPEATLGLLPGAGGTQRAPRLAGAGPALDMLLGGKPVRADAPEAAGFTDRLTDDDASAGAVAFARALIAEAAGPRRSADTTAGLADPMAYQQAVAHHRKAIADRPETVLEEIVACVEAAGLLPFEQGLAFERAAFDSCARSDQCAALRHAFLAERRALRFPEAQSGRASEIDRVGIVGGDAVGSSIAMACLSAGIAVTLIEEDAAALGRALERTEAILERAVQRGLINRAKQERLRGLLSGETGPDTLDAADLVIEALPEDGVAGRDLFASLGEVARPGAVLAASTAGSDLAELAQASGRGGAVLGLYFRFPAHATRLVEIAVGEDCAPDTVATALGLARRLGKVAVRTGSDAGIGAPMMAAYLHAADRMLEAGATPYLIDEAMVAYGMATGPYRAQDLVGLAPGRQGPADAATPVGIAGRLCAAGRFGRRVGKGYYLYEKGAEQGRADPEVIALIRAERERLGITARRFNPEEIQRRCLLAMVNQGARLLRQGVARCPSDIDAVMLHGYGFPRWRGGPMMAADLSGLLHLKNDLAVFAGEEAEFWTPDPVFDELIKNGETFDSLNG